MAIIIPCPSCGVNLSAPETAAGKRIRCPKFGCGTIVAVPALIAAEEVPVLEASPVRPGPRSQSASEDDDEETPRQRSQRNDDDNGSRDRKRRDDDEEERRRRKQRRLDGDDYEFDRKPARTRSKRKGPGSGLLIAGIVLGGILLLGLVAFGIYALSSSKSFSFLGRKSAPPPAGWHEYTYRDLGFKAYFPRDPMVNNVVPNQFGRMGALGGPGRVPFGGPAPAMVQDFNLEAGAMYMSGSDNDPANVIVVACRFNGNGLIRDRLQSEYRRALEQNGSRNQMQVKSVKWLGESGEEITAQDGVIRVVFTNNSL